MLITKEMIKHGIENGKITFKNKDDGTVCSIGQNWFYFGGQTADENTQEEYLKVVPMDDIIDSIYDTLSDFYTVPEFRDEYFYYYFVLKEDESGCVLKVCPRCGSVINFNSYFNAYTCDKCGNKYVHKQNTHKKYCVICCIEREIGVVGVANTLELAKNILKKDFLDVCKEYDVSAEPKKVDVGMISEDGETAYLNKIGKSEANFDWKIIDIEGFN